MELWQRKKLIVICLVVLVCLGLSLWQSTPVKLVEGVLPTGQEMAPAEKKGLTVYVSGAVVNPGMYELPVGSRATDAVEKAGGFTQEANVNKVNLAKKCKDGMQVNVPALTVKQRNTKSSQASTRLTGSAGQRATQENQAVNGMVNINTADLVSLETLPGVGEVTAKQIIDYRTQHRFNKIEDIMKVNGIGPAKFAKMKDFLEI